LRRGEEKRRKKKEPKEKKTKERKAEGIRSAVRKRKKGKFTVQLQ